MIHGYMLHDDGRISHDGMRIGASPRASRVMAIHRLNTMEAALKAIADMKVNEDTNHAELSALCIVIAKAELGRP